VTATIKTLSPLFVCLLIDDCFDVLTTDEKYRPMHRYALLCESRALLLLTCLRIEPCAASQMQTVSDSKAQAAVPGVEVKAAAGAAALRALPAKWIARLTPALDGSRLLADLIGIVADYALAERPRWSPYFLAPRVQLSDELDADGCSPTVVWQKFDGARPEHNGTAGWNGALSHEPIRLFPTADDDSAGTRVRWGCALAEANLSARATMIVAGVARGGAGLVPRAWGVDDSAWAVFFRTSPSSVLAHKVVRSLPDPNLWQRPASKPPALKVVWCTADLQADTLSFAGGFEGGVVSDWSDLKLSVPSIGECFAYAAKGSVGFVTLVLPPEVAT
jgi:hypothetical protein